MSTSENRSAANGQERAPLPTTSLAVVRSVADELGAIEWRSAVLRERLYGAVRDAVGAGVPQATVADAAGVSRQRVGQIMALDAEPEGVGA